MNTKLIDVSVMEGQSYLSLFSQVPVIKRNEPYPHDYQVALRSLWTDANVRSCLIQANECAINDSAE